MHTSIANHIEQVGENEYLVDGSASVDTVFEYFDVPENEESQITTVNGWVMENTDKIPEVGDSFEYDCLSVTVESVEGRRADKIKIVYNRDKEEEDV